MATAKVATGTHAVDISAAGVVVPPASREEAIANLQRSLSTVRTQIAALQERRNTIENSLVELQAEASADAKMATALGGLNEAEIAALERRRKEQV